jgi:uncharacterized protein YjbI with pentapeptide repeats
LFDRKRKRIEGAGMKIESEKHSLDVRRADLSGSRFADVSLSGSRFEDVNLSGCDFRKVNLAGCSFDDLNMSGWRVHNVNLAGLRIEKANLAGATIDGIAVTDMLDYWRIGHGAKGE